MTDEIDYSTADLVCCEFNGAEGDGSVAVGYKPWVILPENEDDFQKVIDDSIPITIKWPKNVEVQPPPKMARAVAKQKNLKWELWPGTKIYGVGSWLEMTEMVKNITTTGQSKIDKSNRKNFKKRADPDQEDLKVANLKKQKLSDSKSKKKELADNTQQNMMNLMNEIDAGIISSTESAQPVTKKPMPCGMKKERTPRKRSTPIPSSEDDDSHTDDSDTDDDQMKIEEWRKKVSVLEAELLLERKDNSALKQENKCLKDEVKTTKRELKEIKTIATSRKYLSEMEEKLKDMLNLMRTPATSARQCDVSSAVTQKLPSSVVEFTQKLPLSDVESTRNKSSANICSQLGLSSAAIELSTTNSCQETVFDDHKTKSICDNLVSDGLGNKAEEKPDESADSVFNEVVFFAKCSKVNLSSFVNDAMDQSFDDAEMAESTISGKVPNFYKKHPELAQPRKQLDPIKIERIKNYAEKHFPNEMKLLNNCIRNKCGNAKKKVQRMNNQSSSLQ
ncbi:uncharacterized protein LOC135838962 isoform X1 [Planococcus citri]|uniref:uncharacterized protein LOC135838962 isoform X1 n=1 Tax=Planococcus citri TaxID=170843 RepID=UPI0031F763F6